MRRQVLVSTVFALTLGLSVTSAQAQGKRHLSKAESLSRVELATLLWASEGTCSDARDDSDRRVCERLAERTRSRLGGTLRVIRVEPAVVETKDYKPRARSLPVVVKGCLFCDGIDVMGKSVSVLGSTEPKGEPGPLRETAIVLPDADAATEWMTTTLPRLVADVYVEVPEQPIEIRNVDGKSTVVLEVRAYRVFDPCTGNVAVSQPRSKRGPKDAAVCARMSALAERQAAASSPEAPADKASPEVPADKASPEAPADKASPEAPADKASPKAPADPASPKAPADSAPAPSEDDSQR